METNNKHTAGNWTYGKFNNFEYFDIDADGNRICSVYAALDAPHEEQEEAEANAKLIAAAPKLLEALIKCQYQLQTWAESDAWSTHDEEAYQLADEAIKEATN